MSSFDILPETLDILPFLKNVSQWYSWYRKDLKTLWPFFMNGSNCFKATEPLRGDSLLFTNEFPGVVSSFDGLLKDERLSRY